MMSLAIHISFVEIVSISQKEETALEPKRAKGQQLNCETRQDSCSTTPGGSDKAHLLPSCESQSQEWTLLWHGMEKASMS